MPFILMFALQCFFPIFDLSQREFTGVSIVNPERVTREFTVTATSSDGTNPRTAAVTLNANTQRAFLLGDLLGAPDLPAGGWIRIDSAAASCAGYLTSETSQDLVGAEPSAASASMVLPRISINTGFTELNHTDTQVAIVNPNNAAASVTLQLLGMDGAPRGEFPLTIAAQGSRTLRVSDVFRNVLPNNSLGGKTFEGSVRLKSDVAVAAWQRIEKPMSKSVLRGRSTGEVSGTSLAVIPHFVFGGNYDSTLNILNPGSVPQTLELTALDNTGRRMGDVVRVTLAAGESRRSSVPGFFRMILPAVFPLPVISGYIRIREPQGKVFEIAGDIRIDGLIDFGAGGVGSSMMYPIADTPSTLWTTPFAVSSPPYFTGYAIVNANELLAVQTNVTVDVVNSGGVVVSQAAVELSPLARFTSLVPPGVSGGFLRFSSNFPVYVMSVIGTPDLRLLDALPVVR